MTRGGLDQAGETSWQDGKLPTGLLLVRTKRTSLDRAILGVKLRPPARLRFEGSQARRPSKRGRCKGDRAMICAVWFSATETRGGGLGGFRQDSPHHDGLLIVTRPICPERTNPSSWKRAGHISHPHRCQRLHKQHGTTSASSTDLTNVSAATEGAKQRS